MSSQIMIILDDQLFPVDVIRGLLPDVDHDTIFQAYCKKYDPKSCDLLRFTIIDAAIECSTLGID